MSEKTFKVAVKEKGKTELSYIPAEQLKVGGETLEHFKQRAEELENAFNRMTEVIEKHSLIKPGDAIRINGRLEEVKEIEVLESNITKPLKFYKVEKGQLVLDPTKVRVIIP